MVASRRWTWVGAALAGLFPAAGAFSPAEAEEPPSTVTGVLCSPRGDFWSRPRTAAVRRGCALLLKATARLEAEPLVARDWAREAHAALDGSGLTGGNSALWVEAHAELLLGNVARAEELFLVVQKAAPADLPLSFVLARARTARASGKTELALAWYRKLAVVERAPLGPRGTSRALLEAAFVASQLGSAHFREAVSYAERAERAGEPLLRDYARAVRVLLATRSGDAVLASEIARSCDRPALVWLIEEGPQPSAKAGSLLPLVGSEDENALLEALERAAAGKVERAR